MHITPKLGEGLAALLAAPGQCLTRRQNGFGKTGAGLAPAITRRMGNQLVNAGLADYNDRLIPSAITLSEKGISMARAHAAGSAKAAA